METSPKRLLVANSGSDSLTLIDINHDYGVEHIFLYAMLNNQKINGNYQFYPKIGAHQIVRGPGPDIIYSVNAYDNSVFKINIRNRRIEDLVHVGRCPAHLALLDGLIFVVNSDSNAISVVDQKDFTLIQNIPVGEKPHDIKVDQSNKKIYIANSNGYSINIIDLANTKEETIKLDIHPLHLYPRDGYMYILSPQSNGMKSSCVAILDLDTRKISRRICVQDMIVDMTTTEEKNIVYTTNASDGCLYKLDFSKGNIIDKHYFGGMPNKILWDGEGLFYISNIIENTVTVYDYVAGKVLRHIPVGLEPSGMIFV